MKREINAKGRYVFFCLPQKDFQTGRKAKGLSFRRFKNHSTARIFAVYAQKTR